MCGEKKSFANSIEMELGSPPHVRGKAKKKSGKKDTFRITPACAGKSLFLSRCFLLPRDHPRMCGEKKRNNRQHRCTRGSPPHVRGKGSFFDPINRRYRITPACAGKRLSPPPLHWVSEDHPRMCGEKDLVHGGVLLLRGSPPHVRGKELVTDYGLVLKRITPACAGKRLKRSRSTVPPVAIVPLFPSVCNKPVVSDGSPAGRDAPLFLPAENAVPASPAYNLRSL